LGRDGGRPAKPTIVVLSAGCAPIERAVLAGIEEEGVPYTVDRITDRRPATELAPLAAARSPLGVGVGVDSVGRVCVHPDKLATVFAELISRPGDPVPARALGHNAARIVIGLPLKPLDRA
jgi:hypothetical protein